MPGAPQRYNAPPRWLETWSKMNDLSLSSCSPRSTRSCGPDPLARHACAARTPQDPGLTAGAAPSGLSGDHPSAEITQRPRLSGVGGGLGVRSWRFREADITSVRGGLLWYFPATSCTGPHADENSADEALRALMASVLTSPAWRSSTLPHPWGPASRHRHPNHRSSLSCPSCPSFLSSPSCPS